MERGFSSGDERDLASIARRVVAFFEEARQGLECLPYPMAVAILARPA
jgi:hypothetical protein